MSAFEEFPADVIKAARAAYDSPIAWDGTSLNSVVNKYAQEYVIAAISEAIMAERNSSRWQPIETAPKDRTEFIAYDGYDRRIVRWDNLWIRSSMGGKVEDLYGWVKPGDAGSSFKPTLWQPLPTIQEPQIDMEALEAEITAASPST